MTDARSFAAAGLLLVVGCYSGVEVDAAADSTLPPGQSGGDSEGSGDDDSDPSGGQADEPEVPQLVARSGMRRLTRIEFVDTVADLTGVALDGATSLPSDDLLPFDNDYTVQAESASLIVAVESLATEVADAVVGDPARWAAIVPCAADAVDEACFDSFVRTFGRRALRRPITDDEATRWADWMLAEAEAAGDPSLAVATALRLFIQHPEFLYRIDSGEQTADDADVVRLDDWAVASRLSFLLWGVGPDDALLDAAEQGRLGTPDDVEVEALRMLADDRAKERVQRFHAMWMGYEVMAIGGDLGESMRAETGALINRIVFDEERPWQELFRSTETFVDDALAEHYGIEAPTNPAGDWVDYGESGRAGVLSHGTFLSNGFKDGDTSPIVRGQVISTMLLCLEVPEPPPNVPPPPPHEEGACKIDEAAAHLTQASCAGCHAMLDTLGFGLENYDEFGQWRAHDVGRPECEIAGDGEVPGVGPFNGPGELGLLIADSELLNACLAKQAYRFAVGRTELDEVDAALIDRTREALGEGDFEFKQLLLQHVTDPAFGFARHTEID